MTTPGKTDKGSKESLTTDMVANPQLHRLGLMVSDTSMDVAITSKVSDNSLIYRHIHFPDTTDSVRNIEEAVYANPLLTADFGHVDVILDTPRFFLMDSTQAVTEEINRRAEILYPADNRDNPEREIITNHIENGRNLAVTVTQRALLRFLRRTFNNLTVSHRMAVLARYHALRNRLGNAGKLHIRLLPGRTDIIALGNQGLLMANTFSTGGTQDALYYTLAAAQQLSFNNDTDRVMVGGLRALRDPFISAARQYIPFVMPELYPSALTRMGADQDTVPFEILAPALCE